MPKLSSTSKAAALKANFENFLFVFPALAIFCFFYIFPFVQLFYLSFSEWMGIGRIHFVGIQNFQELLTDIAWWRSLWNATYVTLFALTFQNALAFALALACDREIRMKRFYRVVFFIPPVLSEVVVGILWNWILYSGVQNGEQIGILNYFFDKTGFQHLINDWLSDPDTALTCVAVVHSWKGFGWGFIMLLAGLQTIDKQLYEAARVDGAGSWNVFKNVTIPMMMPVIMLVIILTIINSMQVFVLIISLTGQGLGDHTSVPVTQILGSMTGTKRFGYASAQAVVFGIILVITSFTLKRLSDKVKQA